MKPSEVDALVRDTADLIGSRKDWQGLEYFLRLLIHQVGTVECPECFGMEVVGPLRGKEPTLIGDPCTLCTDGRIPRELAGALKMIGSASSGKWDCEKDAIELAIELYGPKNMEDPDGKA